MYFQASLYQYPLAILIALIDAGLTWLAGNLAYYVRHDSFQWPPIYEMAVLLAALLVIVLCAFANLYGSWRGLRLEAQLLKLLACWLLAFGLLMALLVFAKQTTVFSRIWLALWFFFAIFLDFCWRILIFRIGQAWRRRGHNLKPVQLIGKGQALDNVLRNSRQQPEAGFYIDRCIRLQEEQNLATQLAGQNLETACEIWICLPLKDGALLDQILRALHCSTAEIRYFPGLDDMRLLNHKVSEIVGLYAIDLSCTKLHGVNQWLKKAEDKVFASLLGVLALPLGLLIALALKLSDPNAPVLFRQQRDGLGGRKFEVYKFRTMRPHKEPDGQVTQARPGDARITHLGAWLRKTSLDELPQFINVLRGDMTLVGPRPHALAHNEYYKNLVQSYMWRHKVKPGITGWAQINGYRGATDSLEKMQKRVEYDLWYIENWSLWLDLKIIVLTVFKGFIHRNAY